MNTPLSLWACIPVFFLAANPETMADVPNVARKPVPSGEKANPAPQFKFSLRKYPSSSKNPEYILMDSFEHHPKAYALEDYLESLEQFLKQQQAEGFPMEKITSFCTFSLGRADEIQKKFKQLAIEGKSRVSKKDGHYMTVCKRLVREENLLAPYKEFFRRFGLEVSESLAGESKMTRKPLDVPGRKSPVYYFTEGIAHLKLAPLEQKAP